MKGTQAMSFCAPPVPESIRLTFDRRNWRQFPRWYPTIGILRCLEQMIRHSDQLSPDDAQSVYAHCKLLSGGLESGEVRNYDEKIQPHVCVLFYQKQVCKCSTAQSSTSSTKEKNVCSGSPGCVSFMVIIQEEWQRTFAYDFVSAHFVHG